MSCYCYILLCHNKHYYTGVANDPNIRIKDHCRGRGAKYTKANGVRCVMFCAKLRNKKLAMALEREIKRMSKKEKTWLIEENHAKTTELKKKLKLWIYQVS